MEPLVPVDVPYYYIAPPIKRRLVRGPSMWIYVVEAKGRLFTFSALFRAETFVRRVKRLPSSKAELQTPFAMQIVATRCNGSMRGPWRKSEG